MTKTKKTRQIVSIATFMLVCFATLTYADSFVNEGTMSSLKDFRFGQAISIVDHTDNSVAVSNQGDSFVNSATMDFLNDFEFGVSDGSSYTVASNTESVFDQGDSFVSAEVLNELESVRTLNLSLRR